MTRHLAGMRPRSGRPGAVRSRRSAPSALMKGTAAAGLPLRWQSCRCAASSSGGAAQVLISTGLENTPALRAYERAGFVRRHNQNEWQKVL